MIFYHYILWHYTLGFMGYCLSLIINMVDTCERSRDWRMCRRWPVAEVSRTDVDQTVGYQLEPWRSAIAVLY